MIQPKQRAKNSQPDLGSTWHTDRLTSVEQHFRVWRPIQDLNTSASRYRFLLPKILHQLRLFLYNLFFIKS